MLQGRESLQNALKPHGCQAGGCFSSYMYPSNVEQDQTEFTLCSKFKFGANGTINAQLLV
jgi:hypothetical protein